MGGQVLGGVELHVDGEDAGELGHGDAEIADVFARIGRKVADPGALGRPRSDVGPGSDGDVLDSLPADSCEVVPGRRSATTTTGRQASTTASNDGLGRRS